MLWDYQLRWNQDPMFGMTTPAYDTDVVHCYELVYSS